MDQLDANKWSSVRVVEEIIDRQRKRLYCVSLSIRRVAGAISTRGNDNRIWAARVNQQSLLIRVISGASVIRYHRILIVCNGGLSSAAIEAGTLVRIKIPAGKHARQISDVVLIVGRHTITLRIQDWRAVLIQGVHADREQLHDLACVVFIGCWV